MVASSSSSCRAAVEGIHPFAMSSRMLYVPREKKIITRRVVYERSMTTIFPECDNGPSTRCNCSIILFSLFFLVSFYLFPSLSRSLLFSRTLVPSFLQTIGAPHFVIQYVGVHKTPLLRIRMDGSRRPDTCMRVTPAYTFYCVFKRTYRRKKTSFSRVFLDVVCSCYNHSFEYRL